MNEPGDLPLTHTSTPDSRPPCSIISIIPTIGMSSCRGRAEAFARSLSSKLRTLGSQTNEEGANAEDEPIINGTNTNTWVNAHESEQTVTDLQPLRHESDSFFDFDCELESPGSPVDECEYLRLIETASNTPHNSTAESGYACASVASSHSSTDGPYYDAAATSNSNSNSNSNSSGNGTAPSQSDQLLVTTQQPQPQRHKLPAAELKEYVNALKLNGSHELLTNGGLVEEQEQEQQIPEQSKQLEEIEVQTEAEMATDTVVSETISIEKEVEVTEIELKEETNVIAITEMQSEDIRTIESSEDEVNLQAQILNELQQHSDSFKGTDIGPDTGNGHCPSLSLEQAEDQELIQTSTEENRVCTESTAEIIEGEMNKGVDETDNKVFVDYSIKLTVDVDIANLEQTKVDSEETTTTTEKSSHSHGIDTTDDEDDCRPQRVRRCSSLKTGKTPPGTPGRKKIVRFADVLGLDLADVKTFLDEVPTIPKSAFEDLEILESEPPLQLGPKSDKLLMPLFQQPGGLPTFLDAVREKQVSLENAAVTDNINQTISGSVRVRNLDFHKSVHVRYSLDGWRSFADLQANYVENSCDGFSDKFTFVLFGNSLHVGQRLEFAVRFQCKGQQFWDNNYGANYCFQCLPSSNHAASSAAVARGSVPTHHTSNLVGMLSPTVGDAWCSSFY